MGDQPEGGGAAGKEQQSDGERHGEDGEPDPQAQPPEPAVSRRELGGARRDDREAEEGHRSASVAPGLARSAGVDANRRLGLLALEHRGAALTSHGC